MKVCKDFIEMWQEADFIDAQIGGVDSLSESEYFDYVGACLMALADDFAVGKEPRAKLVGFSPRLKPEGGDNG